MIYLVTDRKPRPGSPEFFAKSLKVFVFGWMYHLKIHCSDKTNGLNFDKLNAMIKAMDLIMKNSSLQEKEFT